MLPLRKVFRTIGLSLALLLCHLCPASPTTPVILISVDTLRADHLSCYQPTSHPTPHIDSLSDTGTIFTQINSPYPLTLPAHVAMFTSAFPASTGVQDNGIPLQSNATTLTTVLKKAGYSTGAFVASFVLDRRFGLGQSFDIYEGPIDLHKKVAPGLVERKRPGAQVAEAAMRWIERNADAPFFLFLHLYDLHLPYDLPQNPALRHGETGYAAELSYEDRVIGDFLAFLARRQLFDKALIVFTSDHGEGLGDHGETTHGYFIYQSTVRVPLIIHWPAGIKRAPQQRVAEPASLLDIAPTILDAIALSAPQSMRGHSLLSTSTAPSEVYSESLYSRNHFGCAPLRSLRAGSYKYIDAPKPELYDLSTDPKELHNLYDQQRSRAAAMAQRIAGLRTTSVAKTPSPTPDTVKNLRSLGYLAGPASSSRSDPRVDPKDRAADFERYLSALNLMSAGKLAESDTLLRSLRDRLPDITDIRISLGLTQQRLGRFAEAVQEFKAAIAQAPNAAQTHFELGFCYYHLRNPDDAVPELKTALQLEPWYTRAEEALAEISIQKKNFSLARSYLNHLLSIDPNSYTAHYNLGIMAAMDGNWNEAEKHMRAALDVDPASAEAHDTLGKIYLQRGRTADAEKEFRAAKQLGSK
jgi:arylsulfatase A-like enzyme/Flp pilus assembly protein TadD